MWVHDVEIRSDVERGQPISTTGGHVWDAARRLAEYLEAMEEELGLAGGRVRILELGAGTGFLGMTVARNLPMAKVCVTEMEYGGALEHLEFNVASNRGRIPLDNLTVSACDWTQWMEGGEGGGGGLGATEWDLVIGSDLIYNEAGVDMLPKVLQGLVGGGRGAFLYAHTKHRFDMLDQDFMANVDACGLTLRETVEKGREMPPASPPLFESLFAEMRVAVWRIAARGAGGEGAGARFERARYVAEEEADDGKGSG